MERQRATSTETLHERSVHDVWEGRYRAREDAYRKRLFDFVAAQFGDPAAGFPVLEGMARAWLCGGRAP